MWRSMVISFNFSLQISKDLYRKKYLSWRAYFDQSINNVLIKLDLAVRETWSRLSGCLGNLLRLERSLKEDFGLKLPESLILPEAEV